jgi:hypothetical protein
MKPTQLRRQHVVTFFLALIICTSFFELIPGLRLDKGWTYFVTASPRPTPFIRRTSFYEISHEISFRFEFPTAAPQEFAWSQFRPWRQQFSYPHHALLPIYRPFITAAQMNPSVLKTVLGRLFCQDNLLLREFHLPQTPSRVSFMLGRPEESQRLEMAVECP